MIFRSIQVKYLNKILKIQTLSGSGISQFCKMNQGIRNLLKYYSEISHSNIYANYRTLIIVFILFHFIPVCGVSNWTGNGDWEQVPEILSNIVPPTFPPRDFYITDYDAVGDGNKDCTAAIKQAIDACHESGGGRVVIPAGIYLTGAIHLKSNINLHITQNATLLFSTDPQKYLPLVYTRFEGVECMN